MSGTQIGLQNLVTRTHSATLREGRWRGYIALIAERL